MSTRHPISPAGSPQVRTLSVTSAQSSAFGATTKAVRLVSDVDCFVLFAASPTATTSSIYLPAKTPQVFGVTPGHKVAGIVASSTGNLYITESASVIV